MSPRSASHRYSSRASRLSRSASRLLGPLGSDKPRGPKRRLTNTGVNIRPIPSIYRVVPSMGPIVSVVT